MAYRFPARGLDGAGDGGRSCPSMSTCGKAFFNMVDDEGSGPGADIAAGFGGRTTESEDGMERGSEDDEEGRRKAVSIGFVN